MSPSLRTPVSSPVSASTLASTSVSTLVVDSASAPTFRACVGGNADTSDPKTVFDGSSILSTDGGIPVDYEDGVLEDEVTSSGTRRPREDDSDASSSKRPRNWKHLQRDATRTDDSVREPWMPSERVIKERYGASNEIPLYVDNRIVDDAEAAAKHFEPTTNQRRDYYISLFHELRYWSSKKPSGRSRVAGWQALCQSWNQFVVNFNSGPAAYRERIFVANFNNGPAAYRERIASAREHFMRFSKISVVQRVHEGSVNANIPCAVPEG
ncbi:hypothetical protein PHMEG_00041716, partial [Phytophthora megakarya]